jgi:TRAP-type C4-dicarboxylate transport system substrate-binding protein
VATGPIRLVALLAVLTLGACGGAKPAPHDPLTLRVAGPAAAEFARQLTRASGGRLRARPVRSVRLLGDVSSGRIDVADLDARALEAAGVTSLSAFGSPWLVSSDALLDGATSDPRVAQPLLDSLTGVGVHGLALLPAGVRYLFAVERPLDTPQAFAGARVATDGSATTGQAMSVLGARALSSVRDPVAALKAGQLDAVEADLPTAVRAGYVSVAPHVSPPLSAAVGALAANPARLRALGPEAAGWIRIAAERTAERRRASDDRAAWATACRGGLQPSVAPRLDALRAALLDVYAALDSDPTVSLAIDRVSRQRLREPAADPWATCRAAGAAAASTAALDGSYELVLSAALADQVGWENGAGKLRMEIGADRYAVFNDTARAAGPEWPHWDFARDPVEVGTLLVRGEVARWRPETSLRVGSAPTTCHFELFRDRLRWSRCSGDLSAAQTFPLTWRKVS